MLACSVVLATAVVLLPLPASAQSSGVSDLAPVEVLRYAGADRYATSLAIARAFVASVPGGEVDALVVVSGGDWAAAVAASAVAGELGAPILSVAEGLTADMSRFVRESGASEAVVVSVAPPEGLPSVPAAVDAQLESLGLSVSRVSGADQYSVSVAAADRLESQGGWAILASGEVFADAQSAGPLSWRGAIPVLLSPPGALHPEVSRWLAASSVERVIVMGGPAALAPEVLEALEGIGGVEIGGVEIERVAGQTRYATAAEFAALAQLLAPGCFAGPAAGLARGDVPFDALGAAPLLGRLCAPLLLTHPDRVPDATALALNRLRRGRVSVPLHVMGGPAAVGAAAVEGYLGAHPAAAAAQYKNRSPGSVLPATDRYFMDHGEIAGLFPQCPAAAIDPVVRDLLLTRMGLYRGFDTEVVAAPLVTEGQSYEVDLAVGWFTDERIRFRYGDLYPASPLTAQWAKRNAEQIDAYSKLGFGTPPPGSDWPFWLELPARDGPMAGLHERLSSYNGYRPEGTGPQSRADRLVTPTGIVAPPVRMSTGWPDGGGSLLFGWMYFMAQFPPLTHEPAAWGMFTLLDTYDARCVAALMLRACDLPVTAATSPHLRNDARGSPLGYVLRDLVCGQAPTAGPLGSAPRPADN